ncbi:hypothetical protein [Nocardia sp. BMG111209]|uniref:hypothetical protein n=1 Tax=Nocardia sp. BMG111209 TaxID=1160137 RepID=UPI00036EA38D|nr:hypothetical protein [Nocardia sp. BMG111209]
MPHSVMVDVTTFISAEEFLLSQNRSRGIRPRDPFSEQCYAELVQSLIYFDEVLVPHPTLLNPVPADYGEQPRILRHLFDLYIARPLVIGDSDKPLLAEAEASAVETLQTNGVQTLLQFVDRTRRADLEIQQYGGGQRLLPKIVKWSDYQAGNIRSRTHHGARISGPDGVEDDLFGKWARASSFALEGRLRSLIPDSEQQLWFIATLVRSLRYSARAKVKNVAYTPHPLRRDFSVMFDLFDDGAPENTIEDVISAIRGIPGEINRVADARPDRPLQLRVQELPLLGGRLWSQAERERYDDERWLQLICGRIDEYRSRAADFRSVLSMADSEEDIRRLEIDVLGVRNQLLRKLGLESAQVNETETALLDTTASIAKAGFGMPTEVPVTQLLKLAYVALRRYKGSLGTPHQKFLYREFVRGV